MLRFVSVRASVASTVINAQGDRRTVLRRRSPGGAGIRAGRHSAACLSQRLPVASSLPNDGAERLGKTEARPRVCALGMHRETRARASELATCAANGIQGVRTCYLMPESSYLLRANLCVSTQGKTGLPFQGLAAGLAAAALVLSPLQIGGHS